MGSFSLSQLSLRNASLILIPFLSLSLSLSLSLLFFFFFLPEMASRDINPSGPFFHGPFCFSFWKEEVKTVYLFFLARKTCSGEIQKPGDLI